MNVGSGFTNGWQWEGFIFQTRELISYLRCRTSAVSGHLLRQDVRRETYRKEIREGISRKRKKYELHSHIEEHIILHHKIFITESVKKKQLHSHPEK
jgi:hypothetical protein